MAKYIKLDDAIDAKCPVEDIWEDCIDCPLDNNAVEPCRMGKWLKSLPSIEVSEDAISREYIIKKLKSSKEFYLSAWEGFSNMDDKDKARCDELDNCIATVINAPSAVPSRAEGEWIDHSDEGYVECPFCGYATTCDGNKDELKFCWKCGERMKGTDNE